MRRRAFLRTGTAVGLTITIAGCNTSSDDSGNGGTDSSPSSASEEPAGGTDSDGEDDQQAEADPENAVRYFFEDETGALGHLADDEAPENYDHTITNSTTESECQEMQRNDRQYPEGLEDGQLTMSVDQMITRTEEIYNNPTEHLDAERAETLGIDLLEEDDEILFTRALIKASQEAGVDSSGLANIVVSNVAEDAVEHIQPGFSNFKLSTLPATEAISLDRQGHSGGVRETEFGDEYGNSGFRHMAGLLQYEKGGETKTKYAEQVESVDATPTFFHSIRDPEESIYRVGLDQEIVNTTGGGNGIRFPEHYVTALEYSKARELESSDDNILGMGENTVGGINSIGDYIGVVLYELVDDMGITGYNNNPDRDLSSSIDEAALDGTLVSDGFGESLEEFITNPSSEERQYVENIARGMYQIQEQEGWGTSLSLTGTIEDPEILPTDQGTVNAVREDQAYDQVRERVVG